MRSSSPAGRRPDRKGSHFCCLCVRKADRSIKRWAIPVRLLPLALTLLMTGCSVRGEVVVVDEPKAVVASERPERYTVHVIDYSTQNVLDSGEVDLAVPSKRCVETRVAFWKLQSDCLPIETRTEVLSDGVPVFSFNLAELAALPIDSTGRHILAMPE